MRAPVSLWTAAGLAALGLSIVAAVTFGPASITAADVWGTIVFHLGLRADAPLSPLRDAIVWDLRLPRVLTACYIGAGLGLSGAVMQALTRNPLADPYLLGLSSGAAFGAVVFVLAGAALLLPLGAFLGSLAALGLALGLAQALGGATPSRAILIGVVVTSLASAATSLLIFWSATGDSYREIISWLMGSLSGADWTDTALVGGALALCAPVILWRGRALDAFAFGETQAASLGVDVQRLRWMLLLATALLTGVMVAVGGAIGFVGLVAPHAVRLVAGSGHRVLLPAVAIVGALLMLWCDTIARSLFDPRELPVGVITAFVGAPAFLYVLMRNRRIA